MSVPGWNDPPLFSHTALEAQGIRKSKLTKRPTQPPPSTPPTAHTPPVTSGTTSPHGPPPPQTVDKRPRPPGVECGGVSDPSDRVGDYSEVISGFESQLEKYKASMKEKEVEEIGRRLEAMRRQWERQDLSTHVMTHMSSLLQALEEGRIAAAQKIQVSLMVDHTSEVSSWMMGVKRLIMRADRDSLS